MWGKAGNERCWDGGTFTFERCCVFRPGSGNERFLPAFNLDHIYVASSLPRLRTLRLHQNLSDASWDEKLPGLLFKQSYAMLRWLEAMPDVIFQGRTVLELGAGIGLLSLHLAARGGLVTATDGSARALRVARANAEANLPQVAAWNRLSWRLVRWGSAQTPKDVRLVGLAPPYELVLCSALLYAPTAEVWRLVRLLWLCTDERSEVLWGSGIVAEHAVVERWKLVTACFEVVEEVDAVAAGYTIIQGTTVARLRRRAKPLEGKDLPC